MRKLVFIAIIASLAMTGCIQKESEKKEGSSDKKVLTENVKLATCNINVGGIRFTKSKNGGENGITLLGLSSQSPKDDAHTCYFTEVSLKQEAVANFRIGKLDGNKHHTSALLSDFNKHIKHFDK